MEIRIGVSELSKALAMMQGIVQKKNTMPILAHILLEVSHTEGKRGVLVLSATDLEVGMKTTCPCDVIVPGAVTILAKALFEIVKVLPGPDLSLKTLQNQSVAVKSGHTNAKLLALSAAEFPQLPKPEGLTFSQIPAQVFSQMIQKTLFCTSTDENRYNLMGVFCESKTNARNSLALVATDGHRLSKVDEKFEKGDFRIEESVILPRKGLNELTRLLEDKKGSEADKEIFELGFLENQAIVKFGETLLSMRLIEGKFPDYHQVIPKISDKILRASRTNFLTSLKRVYVLANDRNQCLKFSIKNGGMTVSCNNPEAGEVSDDVPIEYNGPNVEIGFNARYIIEALSSLEGNNVIMRFADNLSPCLLTDSHAETHVCVIMPMRL